MLKETTRFMLHAKNLLYYFWARAMNMTCQIHNRVAIRSGTKFSYYDLWKGRKPNVKYFHVFCRKCYFPFDREQRHKMNSKYD